MDKARILVVDDDVHLSRLVAIMLENTRLYKTAVENRSHQALATARSFKPDLVLLDVDMPGLDGGGVTQQIRSDPSLKGTPIVFFTSLISKNESRDTIIERGGEKFLPKPIEPEVLIRCIETVLAGAAATPA